MLLQRNIEGKTSHLELLRSLIETSESTVLCSGWLKLNGLRLILPSVDRALAKGAEVTVYSNRKHTSSRASKELSRRSANRPKLRHFIADHEDRYLHTKIYYFRNQGKYTAIIGSANITEGALTTNEELSVILSGFIGDSQHEEVNRYINDLCTVFGS